MRLLMAVVMLVMAAACFGAGKSEVEEVFDSVYGKDISQVTSTSTVKDDIELAAKLLDAAKTIQNRPDLMALLCEKAFELGSKGRQGYQTAVDAMELLADRVPGKRDASRESILKIYRRHYEQSKGPAKISAGERYIDVLLEAADARGEAGDNIAEAALCRKALQIAKQIKSSMKNQIDARVKEALERERVQKRINAMVLRLKKKPSDTATRNKLIWAYILEMDAPEKAVFQVNDKVEEELQENVPAAVKGVESLSAKETMTLGEWYHGLAEKAPASAKEAMLIRASDYYEFHLSQVKPSELSAAKAKLALKKVQDELGKLAAGNAMLAKWSGPWWYLGPFAYSDFNTVYPPEKTGIRLAKYAGAGGKDITWKSLDIKHGTNGGAYYSLGYQPAIAYFLHRNFYSPGTAKLLLRFGADDGIKVWFNGQAVFSQERWLGLQWDRVSVPVTFKKGLNSLMVRIDNGGGERTGLLFRITDERGRVVLVDNRGILTPPGTQAQPRRRARRPIRIGRPTVIYGRRRR
jgi:hypothetical protein